MDDFFSVLKRYKKLVDDHIFAKLPNSHFIPEIENLFEMINDYPRRSGKGLRPSILLIFCQAFGGKIESAINTAAALEIFQNWIVIHDDIEDGSELRRGQPALHVKYGMPLALNAGDALAGKMWELLNDNRDILGSELTLNIIDQFLNMYDKTTAGQHIELSWVQNKRWDLTRDDYFNMCKRKTSWYTCATPALTGAMIAGADEKYNDTITEFGIDLGIAFQIQDDVLNLAGKEEAYGKEIAGDLWEGKRTLITIDLMEKATSEQKEFLRATFDMERTAKKAEDINKIIDLIKEYESLESAIETSIELASKARSSFAGLDSSIDPTQRKVILELIDFMINRKF
ncbi:MAG: polyprenyl synthetase family protein [candidate division Zixibacteria bacterium]|nr:polyprenyl synthetase family protein [candidate division Zixibacteria bacterium]